MIRMYSVDRYQSRPGVNNSIRLSVFLNFPGSVSWITPTSIVVWKWTVSCRDGEAGESVSSQVTDVTEVWSDFNLAATD